MNIYSLVFAFCGPDVLLLRKAKPEWQAGLLNGVGGKLEEGETVFQCARREFTEETTVILPEDVKMHLFHAMYWHNYETHKDALVYCFGLELPKNLMIQAVLGTQGAPEPCIIWKRDKVTPLTCPCMPNVPFLVEMAECLVLCSPEERKLRQPAVMSAGSYVDGLDISHCKG